MPGRRNRIINSLTQTTYAGVAEANANPVAVDRLAAPVREISRRGRSRIYEPFVIILTRCSLEACAFYLQSKHDFIK